MTVRIDPALLGALKAKARRDGRSLSAAVIQLIRLGVEPERPAGKVHTMGMFPDFEAPDLDELVALRRSFSRTLKPKSKKRA